MARLRKRLTSEEDSSELEANHDMRQATHTSNNTGSSQSRSPSASVSSDKENRSSITRQSQSSAKSIPATKAPMATSVEQANKRRRLGELEVPNALSQAVPKRQLEMDADNAFYDPDQPMEQRREVRRRLRDLGRQLLDSRAELMAADSAGLTDIVVKANDIYGNVRQTTDATLDSRLLVSTADLTTRRLQQMKVGSSLTGIDIDEFVAKTIGYMRRGGQEPPAATQNCRGGQRMDDDDLDDSAVEDEGNELNWEHLGCTACFPHNLRPPTPGFLLGPLSVQKKVRKQTQRRERLRRHDSCDIVRPEELQTKDFERQDDANLLDMCKKIHSLVASTASAKKAAFDEVDTVGMTNEELYILMEEHMLADDGGLNFFSVVLNPRSFGQSIENIFYISFLVREGKLGIAWDRNGFPTLHITKPRSKGENGEQNTSKHQMIFHLDFPRWEALVEEFGIKESLVQHRKEAVQPPIIGASGWYG